MDVRNQSRDRVFSILNDNDCPSFVIRQRQSPASPPKRPSLLNSPRLERPNLLRNAKYTRQSSFSSIGSPPLLRFDSTSSKSSNPSMDSTPSPITPAYNYNDPNLLQYDGLLRPDLTSYMPSTITPFMEQQLTIAPIINDPYMKLNAQLPPTQYPLLPLNPQSDIPQLPTPAPSNNSSSASTGSSNLQSKTSPASNNNNNINGKKNKYPCPYAMSHNCQATFTTSGHAARHGKKHTGEKGVHCPVCNKAFTRKDNMKQHERTHKGSISGSNSDDSSKRSKAAITRSLQKNKQKENEDFKINSMRKSSIITSPLSEVTSLAPTTASSLPIEDQPFYSDSVGQILMPQQTIENISPSSLYPPLGEESVLANSLPPIQTKPGDLDLLPMPPLIRGFSDLDTLAQAAESFDNPYYQPTL